MAESIAEQMARIPQVEPPEPRDSALGMLMQRRDGRWWVLFGLRSGRSRFMPGHLAFPGGRMEQVDAPGDPGAFARCAAREFEEETGILVEPGRWIDVGERVTPPLFPVRYRTRFFVAELPAGATLPDAPPRPEEIEQLRLAPAGEVLSEWEAGRSLLPPPALPMLRTLDEHGAEPLPSLAGRLRQANAVEEAGPCIEFVPGVWVVPVRTRTIPPATHTNVWLPGAERFVVLDPGSSEAGEVERLLRVIERRVGQGADLLAILLTHHHPDHVGGAGVLARRLGLPVWAHAQTLRRIALPAGVQTRTLRDGETIDLGGLTLRALHTPGHAPGHLAFEIPERRAALAGDLLSGFSTILVHPSEGDMETYLASLARLRDGGYGRLFPAHGPPLPGKATVKVIEHRLERERLVRASVHASGSHLSEIARAAYRDTPGLPAALIEGQTLAHLEHLVGQGVVRRDPENPDRWIPL